MSIQDDKKEIENLKSVNEELTRSLDKCRALLDTCRDRLAANSNEPDEPVGSEPPALTSQQRANDH